MSQQSAVYPYLQGSFQVTYIILLTTSAITIIEALRQKNLHIKDIMNVETAITLIAGYFYSIFVVKLDEAEKSNVPIKWETITKYRYIDWSITTPFMLLALCMVLSQHSKTVIHFVTFFMIIVLNYIMLLFGYLGEVGIMGRTPATIAGFASFLVMFFIIFKKFIQPKYSRINTFLFSIYLFFWSLYGIVYLFDEEYKNLFTNILDLITKCLVGLGLWIYYTHTIVK